MKDDGGSFRDDANSVSSLVGPVGEDDAGKGADMLSLMFFLSTVFVCVSSTSL